MSIKLIQPATIERDEHGYWTHPDYPEHDEDSPASLFEEWFTSQGLESACVLFEDDAPEELQDAWLESGEADVEKWQPTTPKGDGWFLLSLHDTENGPVAIFARPMARIVEPPKHIESSPFPSPEFRFFIFDPNAGDFVCFRTAEDRDAKIDDIISTYCDDGWEEEVEQVCIGEISGVSGKTNVQHRPEKVDEEGYDEDGGFWGEFDYKCDYGIVRFPPRISQAAQDVIAERRRQVEAEGFASERDDQYVDGQLAAASASYSIDACALSFGGRLSSPKPPSIWPWDAAWWKPAGARCNLVKSAALAIAEIERLDRAAAKAGDV